MRIPGEVSARVESDAASSHNPGRLRMPRQPQTGVHYRNQLPRTIKDVEELALTRDHPTPGTCSSRIIFSVTLAGDLMHLRDRRCGEADENDDAITARIPTEGVDAEIGFPVINGPDVAGLIDAKRGLTHHWYEARRPWG